MKKDYVSFFLFVNVNNCSKTFSVMVTIELLRTLFREMRVLTSSNTIAPLKFLNLGNGSELLSFLLCYSHSKHKTFIFFVFQLLLLLFSTEMLVLVSTFFYFYANLGKPHIINSIALINC